MDRYGVVLRKLDLLKEAVEVFVEATHTLPLHWGAWLELCNLLTNIEMVWLLSSIHQRLIHYVYILLWSPT